MKKRLVISAGSFGIGIMVYFLFYFKLLSKSNILLILIRNYLPDICWTISFFFIGIVISKDLFKRDILFNSLYVLLLALIYELLQLFNVINGTFDLIDILIYMLSITLCCLIEKYFRRRKI